MSHQPQGFNTIAGLAIAVSLGCLLGLIPVVLLQTFSIHEPIVQPVTDVIHRQAFSVTYVDRDPMIHATQTVRIIRPPKLLFVGDLMFDRKVAERIKAADDSDYVFSRLPDGWIDSFDFAVGNLEGPVTDVRRPPVKSIDFMFNPSVIPVLQRSGFDAFSQANNHSLDQGRIGYEDSIRRLKQGGFLVFGDQVEDDAFSMTTTTIGGVSFALLGFNVTDNALDRVDAAHAIDMAARHASHTIVFMHWGVEYTHEPTAQMKELAYWFIDQGVSMIVGAHPHWVQGIEVYKQRPIVYSLGNFVFDQDFSLETRNGLAMSVTVYNDRLVLEPIPIYMELSQPRLVEGEERMRRLQELARFSDTSLRKSIESGELTFTFP